MDDLNRQTDGPTEKFLPPLFSPLTVVTHLHIEGELSKRALSGSAGGGGGKREMRSKSPEDDRGQEKKNPTVTEAARRDFFLSFFFGQLFELPSPE